MAHIHTAAAQVAGGRTGHGRTHDGRLEVDLSRPGSDGTGTNPEQLFAIAYAACFEGALATVARRRRIETGPTGVDSTVSLFSSDDGAFEIAATLNVTIPAIEDPALAAELTAEAHRVCPYSNATRGNIAVALTVNGAPLE